MIFMGLITSLERRGVQRLYGASCERVGVLSVAYGVTVWTNGRVLCWHASDDETRLPAADPAYAVLALVRLMREPPEAQLRRRVD